MTKPKGKAVPDAKASRASAKRSVQSGTFASANFAASTPMSESGFLAKTKLKKAGGSLIMTVPASARNLLGLIEGQEMTVSVEGSKVIMEPIPTAMPVRVKRPKYTLEQLLVDANPDAPLSGEERTWHDAPPMGREVW